MCFIQVINTSFKIEYIYVYVNGFIYKCTMVHAIIWFALDQFYKYHLKFSRNAASIFGQKHPFLASTL